MEVYAAVIAGILGSLFQSVANKYFKLSEGEKATATIMINFISTIIVIALIATTGQTTTIDATIVVGGITLGANQLWHILVKYIPRLLKRE